MSSATFQVGNTYTLTTANYGWTFEIISRTARYMTIRNEQGESRRVRVHPGATEYAFPLGGNYPLRLVAE